MRELKIAFKDLLNHKFLLFSISIILTTLCIFNQLIFSAYNNINELNVGNHLNVFNTDTQITEKDKVQLFEFIKENNVTSFSTLSFMDENNNTSSIIICYGNYPTAKQEFSENDPEFDSIMEYYKITNYPSDTIKFIIRKTPKNIIINEIYQIISNMHIADNEQQVIQKLNATDFDSFKIVYSKTNLKAVETHYFKFSLTITMLTCITILLICKVLTYVVERMKNDYTIHSFYGAKNTHIILRTIYLYLYMTIFIIPILIILPFNVHKIISVLIAIGLVSVILIAHITIIKKNLVVKKGEI